MTYLLRVVVGVDAETVTHAVLEAGLGEIELVMANVTGVVRRGQHDILGHRQQFGTWHTEMRYI